MRKYAKKRHKICARFGFFCRSDCVCVCVWMSVVLSVQVNIGYTN